MYADCRYDSVGERERYATHVENELLNALIIIIRQIENIACFESGDLASRYDAVVFKSAQLHPRQIGPLGFVTYKLTARQADSLLLAKTGP